LFIDVAMNAVDQLISTKPISASTAPISRHSFGDTVSYLLCR
jgi:hypothetical protein